MGFYTIFYQALYPVVCCSIDSNNNWFDDYFFNLFFYDQSILVHHSNSHRSYTWRCRGKTVKDAFDVVGIEDQLKKLQAESALGGIAVSSMVGAVLKWYIVLLFMGEGMMRLQLSFISDFIKDVLIYIPAAISGLVLIVVSLIVGRYASECIKSSKNPFSDLAAAAVEVMIIFFGIVISLPILKEDIDVSVLTDSFKILMAGLSLGLAIALGLGCKEYFVEQFTKSKKHG